MFCFRTKAHRIHQASGQPPRRGDGEERHHADERPRPEDRRTGDGQRLPLAAEPLRAAAGGVRLPHTGQDLARMGSGRD